MTVEDSRGNFIICHLKGLVESPRGKAWWDNLCSLTWKLSTCSGWQPVYVFIIPSLFTQSISSLISALTVAGSEHSFSVMNPRFHSLDLCSMEPSWVGSCCQALSVPRASMPAERWSASSHSIRACIFLLYICNLLTLPRVGSLASFQER